MLNTRYVIVGSGAAGIHAALKIRNLAPQSSITVFSQEPYPFYHKYDLPDYLAGKLKRDDLFHDENERFVKKSIHLRLRQKVTAIHCKEQTIRLNHNETVTYDKLLLATGVSACIHPTYEHFSPYLTLISTLSDVDTILAHREKLKKPLILGGSLTALKIGMAFSEITKNVDYLMFQKLTGNLLVNTRDLKRVRNFLDRAGIRILENIDVEKIEKSGKGFSVQFSNGKKKIYSIIVAGFGVKPNIELAEAAGIRCDTGVLVNPHFESSIKNIYAAGDIAQIYHPGLKDYWVNFGWPNAIHQGEIAAENMCGKKIPYRPDEINVFSMKGLPIEIKSWQ